MPSQHWQSTTPAAAPSFIPRCIPLRDWASAPCARPGLMHRAPPQTRASYPSVPARFGSYLFEQDGPRLDRRTSTTGQRKSSARWDPARLAWAFPQKLLGAPAPKRVPLAPSRGSNLEILTEIFRCASPGAWRGNRSAPSRRTPVRHSLNHPPMRLKSPRASAGPPDKHEWRHIPCFLPCRPPPTCHVLMLPRSRSRLGGRDDGPARARRPTTRFTVQGGRLADRQNAEWDRRAFGRRVHPDPALYGHSPLTTASTFSAVMFARAFSTARPGSRVCLAPAAAAGQRLFSVPLPKCRSPVRTGLSAEHDCGLFPFH